MTDVLEITDPTSLDVQVEVYGLDVTEAGSTTVFLEDSVTGIVEVQLVNGSTVEAVEYITDVVEVDGYRVDVAVTATGERGAPGERGPAGFVTGAGFEQNFAVAQELWVVNHGLGFTPGVTTYDSLGRGIRGHIESNSPTQTVVSFAVPVSGRITLS